MKIYLFDRYKINTDVKFHNNYISDDRLNQKIKIEGEMNRKLVYLIFNNYNVKYLLKNEGVNKQVLRDMLSALYDLDIVYFIRPYSNKCFYDKNFFLLGIKTMVSYIIRFMPYILGYIILALLLNNKLSDIIYNIVIFFGMCFVHEFTHLYCYYLCNSKRMECYFRINIFSIQLITNKTNKKNSRLIAISGPMLASICGILLFMINNEPIVLIFVLLHLSMLLPFFDDGKKIWS